MLAIDFYVSKTHDTLNKKIFDPDNNIPTVCLNPLYKIKSISKNCKVLLDSGAFQDVDSNKRLSYYDALKRQLDFEKDVGFISYRIVSYDQLVDEQLVNGEKIKKRVSCDESPKYVTETINAAKYLSSLRNFLYPRQLVLSCQGTNYDQYIKCLNEILKNADKNDCIGMGGFCIIGRKKSLVPEFLKIQQTSFEIIRDFGIKDVHLFGVTSIPILEKWSEIGKEFDLNLSVDSSSFEVNSVFGRVFDNGKWIKKYTKEDKYKKYHPCDLALENIERGYYMLQSL